VDKYELEFLRLFYISAMTAPFSEVFARLLLQHGGDPNSRSADGLTPVHVAVIWGREETLQILLNHGGKNMNANVFLLVNTAFPNYFFINPRLIFMQRNKK